MKRLFLSLVAASGVLAGLAPGIQAAPWQSINQRQAGLDERIDRGIQRGLLTRAEAVVLRGDFRALANLEAQYRRSGGELTDRERQELDVRFDALARRIRVQRHDEDMRGTRWAPINQRQERIFSRIDDGIRNGSLTRAEAIKLKGEFGTLVRLEEEYRRSGGIFTMDERNDLDRRLGKLSERVMIERRDPQGRLLR